MTAEELAKLQSYGHKVTDVTWAAVNERRSDKDKRGKRKKGLSKSLSALNDQIAELRAEQARQTALKDRVEKELTAELQAGGCDFEWLSHMDTVGRVTNALASAAPMDTESE